MAYYNRKKPPPSTQGTVVPDVGELMVAPKRDALIKQKYVSEALNEL
jgi:hypothetical protein